MNISLITVAYNSAATIGETLESVAAQNYSNLQYIVVDGGSSDATLEVLAQYPGLVTEVISEPDQGIYDAMNKGVLRASGEVVGILNSDDFYVHSEVLKEVAEIFAVDPTLEVVLGDVDFVTDDDLGRPVRTYRAVGFRPWMFRFGLMPPHPAVFVRKSAYDRVGLYKLGYRIAADFDFLVRLILLDGARYKITGRHWVRMRTGGASTAGFKSNMISTREMLRSLRENKISASTPMLLLRLPIKFFRQVCL
ncbi:glycosyl transferase 2 [Stutzerimonas stutzeri ATCC 14405 = CCUG 16156]|uniref:glycosyltransferase family 2 protein n=1 Tax=Stutzerimonas stutzeri subgroup TaxID=578833 RepID=UPI0002548E43|nr:MULTISPECIES: glycosyltransferase family 2 protein [Stutzerimonas stutzeri subgroup]EHY76322.1 glycosyl transferase 2 [Stutzerimonas stutzeri ATCC 14405 = CCUG 16156]QOZ96246.1 glycosyltransferase [Stutzerimonas stutzeri]